MLRIFACLVLIAAAGAAEEAYVTSLYAKVRSATSFPNQTIATLDNGAEVTVLATEGAWSRIRLADGRSGWVASRNLSADAPDGGSVLAAIGRSTRREGADVAGTAGGRGVGPMATEYANGKNAGAALADVEWLERRAAATSSIDRLESFMAEGALGDYQD